MVCKWGFERFYGLWKISFILTKWYVNYIVSISTVDGEKGFILTKWYVN